MDTRKAKSSKSKGNTKTSKNLRIEALKVTIEKKRECNSKALEIVAKCSDETTNEESLLEDLKFINQEHYQDIVEERVINKLCGYPVCPGLLKNIPAKQYHISTVHNKVFDITERKNFCSNLCYTASKFLKDQILTSPVWLRESDEKESYKLISLQAKGGSVGDEVDFGITPITVDPLEENPLDEESSKLENDLKTKEEKFSTCTQMTHEADDSCEEDEQYYDCFDSFPVEETREKENNSTDFHERVVLEETSESTNVTDSHDTLVSKESALYCDTPCKNSENCDTNYEQTLKNPKEHTVLQEKTVDNLDNKKSKPPKTKKQVTNKKPSKRKSVDSKSNVSTGENPIQNLVLNVEKVLKEWFTLESVCFVFGEVKLKEMIEERYNHITQWRQTKNATQDIHLYERYLLLCRKLNVLELKDNQIDNSFKEQIRNPLPDFDKLKEETTEMQLKVNMYFKGDKVKFAELASVKEADDDSSHDPVLPLVDLHAQKAIRKRIVLDRMRRTIEDLRLSLNLREVDLREDVRSLIGTFTLSAHNITLKPAEWNLVSIIVIKLLSCRDKVLEQCLGSSASSKHLTLLLMSYSLDTAYLDRLVTWLTDLDSLIQNP